MFQPANRLKNVDISIIRQFNDLVNPKTINLGIGQLPFNPPKELIEAGIDAFESKELAYTQNAGLEELRDLIASSYNNPHISSDNVIVTSGVQEALMICYRTFLNKEDIVLIPEVNFSPYETLAELERADVLYYQLNNDFSINLETLPSLITRNTKLLVINSPANPTGKVLSRSQLLKLNRILKKFPWVYVLSDEVYSRIYYAEIPTSYLSISDRSIIVDGISKRSAATGLRIGWTIAPKEVTKEMLKIHQYSVTCTSIISQKAAIPVLKGNTNSSEEYNLKMLRRNKELVCKLLSESKIRYFEPEGAFYILIDISNIGDSATVAKNILKNRNVLTIPGIAFGNACDNYIRVSFAADKEELIKGISLVIKELL